MNIPTRLTINVGMLRNSLFEFLDLHIQEYNKMTHSNDNNSEALRDRLTPMENLVESN